MKPVMSSTCGKPVMSSAWESPVINSTCGKLAISSVCVIYVMSSTCGKPVMSSMCLVPSLAVLSCRRPLCSSRLILSCSSTEVLVLF